MTAPKFALVHLSIEEGSVVGEGDNPGAHIALFKSKDTNVIIPALVAKDLPDTSFLVIVKGGARLLPVRDAAGALDIVALAHAFKTIPTLDEGVRATAKAQADSALEQATKDCYGLPRTTATIVAERKFRDEFWTLKWAFSDSVSSILGAMDSLLTEGKLSKLLTQTTSEFEDAISALVAGISKAAPALALQVISLVEATKAACDVEGAAVADAITKAIDDFAPLAPVTKENDMPAPATTAAKNATNAVPTTAKSLDDVLAALPEEARKAIKDKLDADAATIAKAAADAEEAAKSIDTKAKEAVEKRLQTAEAELAKMKDEAELAKFVTIAKGMGVSEPDEVGKLLKSAHARSKEDGDALEKQFRSMAAQARKGKAVLKAVVGSEGPGNNGGDVALPDDPDAALDALAKEIQKKDPKVNAVDAYALALKARPDLYDASVDKSRGRKVEGADGDEDAA